MKLITEQVDLISKEIIEGVIKYQDLYEELLDHYITAIEDRMANGQNFREAFGEVHSGFENYKLYLGSFSYFDARKFTTVQKANFGLARLQSEYEDKLSKEISKRHWEIMKSYFRWPTVITALSVGFLTFQVAHLVPRNIFIWMMFACSFFPLLLILPESIRNLKQYLLKNRQFVNTLKTNAIVGRMFLSIIVFSCFLNTIHFSKGFFEYNLLEQNPIPIITSLSCFYIAYSLSFYQLYRERFKVTMT
jgi:cation transport ATPase